MQLISFLMRTRLAIAFFAVISTGNAIDIEHCNEQIHVGKIRKLGGKVIEDGEGRVKSILFSLPGKLTDEDIESIDFSMLRNLTSLLLVAPKLTDRSLIKLGTIPSLEIITLCDARITDRGLNQFLRQQKSIAVVTCRNLKISDKALEGIGAIDTLGTLDISNSQIRDDGTKEIAKIKNLFALHLTCTEVSDVGLGEIAKLDRLVILGLDGTKVTDTGIQQLANLTNLRVLEVRSTKVTKKGMDMLRARLPKLEIVK